MLASQIPVKFALPFAADAGPSYIRPIPTASQILVTPGAASLTDGFPPATFADVTGGGTFPFGADFNGILNQISAWSQWQNAGAPVAYDSAFSAAVGGYPSGALIQAASGGAWWLSTTDNNVTDPDTGGAGWQAISYGNVYAGNPNGFVAGISPTSTFLTQSMLWDTTNKILWICTMTGTTSTAVWTQLTGSSGGSVVWCGTSTGTANAQTVTTPLTMQSFPTGTAISFKAGTALTNSGAMTLTVGSFGTFAMRLTGPSGPSALAGNEVVAGNIVTGRFDGTFIQLTSGTTGSAAKANASSATGKLAAVSGAFTIGHIAVASDTEGTMADGGLPGVAAAPTYLTHANNGQILGPGVYSADTTTGSGGAFTVKMAAVPSNGQILEFRDQLENWGVNNFTVDGNGNTFTFRGQSDTTLVCNTAGLAISAQWSSSASTWELF